MTDQQPDAVPEDVLPEAAPDTGGAPQEAPSDLEALVAERTADLQRLQAEYVNYKRRVDRDRDLARQAGIAAVLGDLLGVLDALQGARAHGEYEGAVRMLGDEVEKVASKYGLQAYGAKGDPFDPQLHDALMHTTSPDVAVTTCIDVPQVGYRLGDRVLRPARVVVADPADPEPDDEPSAEQASDEG